ncbi:MAG: SH3 domain-containing protein [Nitrospinaceae bacterium]|jgi:uncharacterized protein YgiM (DUF1202 family)|nr:MAG: SH3 domain-containing protein [Nitrospinaceae bacterium]
MAMKRLLVIVTLMLSILALPAAALAETLYVKKSGTKLQSEASASSKVVETLASGTAVEVVKKSGRFYQVTAAGGKKGWIFKFKLTAKAPSGGGGGGSLLDALGGQQMAAKESASGSSIRGLSPISEQHAKSKGISKESINAVKAMEEFKVSAQEVDAFLKAGKLGEYAQ